MRPLSARERKLIAVLILVLAVALVLTIVIGPVASGFSDRAARREALVQTFHANELRIGSLGTLQAEAERQTGAMRGLFMAAPDAGEASEALRERVETAVQELGGDIKASEAVPAEEGWARAAMRPFRMRTRGWRDVRRRTSSHRRCCKARGDSAERRLHCGQPLAPPAE